MGNALEAHIKKFKVQILSTKVCQFILKEIKNCNKYLLFMESLTCARAQVSMTFLYLSNINYV